MARFSFLAAAFLVTIMTPSLFAQTPTPTPEDCACDPPLPLTLATVGAKSISQNDLTLQTVNAVRGFRQEVVDARKKELDLLINSRLLELESKKQGISTKQLLDKEVMAKAKEPTVTEAREFYDKNAARLAGSSFEAIQKDIIDYLRQQNQEQVAKAFADRLRAVHDVRKLVESAPPPSSPADRQKILATVAGQPIKSADVEESLKSLIYNVQKSLYRVRKDDVDLKINDELLDAEAKKQGITTAALLKREVDDKLPIVTEADAQKFFTENKERLSGEFANLKNQIIGYLNEQNKNQALRAFAERLRSATTIKYAFAAPEPPRFEIALADQPSMGAATAPVTVVTFIDFQCKRCAEFHPEVIKLAEEFKGKVRVVMIDYPLMQHANARKAAEAAEAARSQGKYWEFVEVLFHNQLALDVQKLKSYARTVGLDGTRFDTELDSGKYASKVDDDANLAARLGLMGTPSIFVNGRQLETITAAALRSAISAALAK